MVACCAHILGFPLPIMGRAALGDGGLALLVRGSGEELAEPGDAELRGECEACSRQTQKARSGGAFDPRSSPARIQKLL